MEGVERFRFKSIPRDITSQPTNDFGRYHLTTIICQRAKVNFCRNIRPSEVLAKLLHFSGIWRRRAVSIHKTTSLVTNEDKKWLITSTIWTLAHRFSRPWKCTIWRSAFLTKLHAKGIYLNTRTTLPLLLGRQTTSHALKTNYEWNVKPTTTTTEGPLSIKCRPIGAKNGRVPNL